MPQPQHWGAHTTVGMSGSCLGPLGAPHPTEHPLTPRDGISDPPGVSFQETMCSRRTGLGSGLPASSVCPQGLGRERMEKCHQKTEWGERKERERRESRGKEERKARRKDGKHQARRKEIPANSWQHRAQECKDEGRAPALWLLGSCWLSPPHGGHLQALEPICSRHPQRQLLLAAPSPSTLVSFLLMVSGNSSLIGAWVLTRAIIVPKDWLSWQNR